MHLVLVRKYVFSVVLLTNNLSLCWSHIPHCWKSHFVAHMRVAKALVGIVQMYTLV